MFVGPLIELRRLRKRDREKRTFLEHRKEGVKRRRRRKEKGRGARKYIYPGTKKILKCKKMGE